MLIEVIIGNRPVGWNATNVLLFHVDLKLSLMKLDLIWPACSFRTYSNKQCI